MPFNFKPLEPFRDQTVILSGLHSRSAEPPPGVTGADHWVAAAFLCANKPKKTAGADVYAGTTIDQMIAQKIGQRQPDAVDAAGGRRPGRQLEQLRRGLQLHLHEHDLVVVADAPLPMELNPQVVFERMFGDGSTVEQRAARRKRDRSILDSLTGSLVPPAQRRQRRRSRAARRLHAERPRDRAAAADCDEGLDRRAGEHDRAGRRAADLRRAHQAAVRPAGAGVPGRHHPRRHAALRPRPHRPHLSGERGADRRASTACRTTARIRGGSPSCRRSTSTTSRCWRTSSTSWRRPQDGDGTLLDHSLVLYGSNMGNSNQHVHYDVPHVLVGGLNGKLKGGRHLAYPTKTVPTGNLLLSVLDKFDIHQDSIGDSTGRLEDL